MFHRCRRKLLLGSCELCNQVLNNGLQFALFESFVPRMHQIFNIAIIFLDYQTALLHPSYKKVLCCNLECIRQFASPNFVLVPQVIKSVDLH